MDTLYNILDFIVNGPIKGENGESLAWINFVIQGLSLVAGVAGSLSARKSANKAASSQEDYTRYNAAAQLANGRISAELTKFNAVGPRFQALMEADNSKLNSRVMRYNAAVAKLQGDFQADQLATQALFALEDSALEQRKASRNQLDAAKERRAISTQFQMDLDDIEEESKGNFAATQAAYASMGVSMDSGVLEALEDENAQETEAMIGRVLLARTIEQNSAGKIFEEAKDRGKTAKIEGDRQAIFFRTSAKLTTSEAERQALAAEAEAVRLAMSGEYMDWYADFIKESADLTAEVQKTGAQISADNTFAVGMANAANTRASGRVALFQGLGSAASQAAAWAARPNVSSNNISRTGLYPAGTDLTPSP